MEKPTAYYVCIYQKNGKAIGHRVALNPNFPDQLNSGTEQSIVKIAKPDFKEAAADFCSSMMGYLEYVPLILGLAPRLSDRMVTASLRRFLEEKCDNKHVEENRTIYTLNLSHGLAVQRFHENLDAAVATSRSLPRLLTVGLVTTLEYHLSVLMKLIAQRHPEAIFSRDRTIRIQEAVKFQSIDELRESLVNEEIAKVQRDNIDAQIGWIIERASIKDFRPNFEEWPLVLELYERRNLFVHANGTVNNQYLAAQEKYNFKHRVKLGDELHANSQYFSASVRLIVQFGAMLQQVVWRKVAEDQNEAADKAISNFGYDLIVRGQYKLAIKILKFAKELRNVPEVHRRRIVVNLANAYKLDGDLAASEEILGSMEWEATAPEFKICIAAIKGGATEVASIMKKIGFNSEEIRKEDYAEWPVFYHVRDDEEFKSAYAEVFGVEYIPAPKIQAGIAQVMEFVGRKNKSSSNIDDKKALDELENVLK